MRMNWTAVIRQMRAPARCQRYRHGTQRSRGQQECTSMHSPPSRSSVSGVSVGSRASPSNRNLKHVQAMLRCLVQSAAGSKSCVHLRTAGEIPVSIICSSQICTNPTEIKNCPNFLDGGIHKDRASAKQSLLRWPCPLPSEFRSRNSCSRAEFSVECLTYAHSRARPVPSLTSPGYGLTPTVTIPARRFITLSARRASNPVPF